MTEQGTGPVLPGVLFVCLGNICRSPMARWVFEDMATRRGVRDRVAVDSCGLGSWHEGQGADPRAVRVGAAMGLRTAHVARRLHPAEDFARYQLLLAMDARNLDGILRAAPDGFDPSRARLLRSFDPALRGAPAEAMETPDPYEEPESAFRAMHAMIVPACAGLLEHLLARGPA